MLLIYLALIGSAGWHVGDTSARVYSGAGPRLYDLSSQLPGAASLARTTEIVRKIEAIVLYTPGCSHRRRSPVFPARREPSPATRPRYFRCSPVEERVKKGLTSRKIVERTAREARRDQGRQSFS